MAFEQFDHLRAHKGKRIVRYQTKKICSLKDPRYNLRSLATAAEDILHVHEAHDGGHDSGKATNQFRPLCLPVMVQEPRCHLTEVLAGK